MTDKVIWLMVLAGSLGAGVFLMRRSQPANSNRLAAEALQEDLRDSHTRLSNELDKLGESHNQLSTHVAQAQKHNERLEPLIQHLSEYLEQAADHLEAMEGLNSSMTIVAGQVESKQRRAQSVIDGLDIEYRNLQRRVGQLDSIGQNLAAAVQGIGEQHQELKARYDSLGSAVSDIAEHNLELTNQTGSLASFAEGVRSHSHLLHGIIQEITQRADNLAAAEQEITKHALELPEQQEQYQHDRAALLDGLRRLTELALVYETTKQEMADELIARRSTVERLTASLSSFEGRLESEQQQHQETKATLRQQITTLGQVKEELNQANAGKAYLEQRVEELESSQDNGSSAGPQPWFLRPAPQSFDDLVSAVRDAFLDSIALPPTAVSEIGELKSIVGALQMAGDAWRAVGALHEYATLSEPYGGNFYDWCRFSGHRRAYPQGDVAMNESQTTKQHKSNHKGSRMFYVDTQVEPSGQIEMFAHIKFGGTGQNRPRLYFHDDTKGKTGKIHIGFLGPHSEVKNAGSN